MTDLTVIEPATEQVLAVLARTTGSEVESAVEAAQQAQYAWSRTSPSSKAAVLRAIADLVEERAEDLALVEARNVGMPLNDARAVVSSVAETFRYYAAGPERLTGQTIPVAGGVNMTFHEPIGVVALITPWNYPMSIASWKIAPALAAGNAVLLKPAELTPLSSIELQRIAVEAGLPEGLFSVLVGPGSTIGTQLVEHPCIGKIAFTGSTSVGVGIAARAAQTMKRTTLELGGKSASIVFADSDLRAAAEGLAGGVFGNAGQDCCARSRVFVERFAVDEFLGYLRETVAGLQVGDPLNPATQMGPLISQKQLDAVRAVVDSSPVAFQGNVPQGPGYWFPPTVLYPIDDAHPAATEEIFGPVVCILPFETEEEVIKRTNDSVYGLSGSVWTRDGARALRVARAVESGTLSINSYTSVRVSTPFGGFKQSGIGRELGPDALETYTEVKNVYYNTQE
nr:aldehyde dehydrogenase family protein [Arthrobacter crystallopoietes]